MIECIFTLDYEIYGNGYGALQDLVYEPAERLREIFAKRKARFVNFVEVAEFEKIEAAGSDPAIERVKRQIKDLRRDGFEIALHLHPQWSNAAFENGRWRLDASEYNLCTLSRTRIAEIVGRALDYLRYVVGQSDFAPLSFRAGNWLFQPTATAASVLAEAGIKIDSSVFKGGVQHQHGLDYRPALRNGYYWSFSSDANREDPRGGWIEVPIHTEQVPFWRMATSKRMSFGNGGGAAIRAVRQKVNRARDLMRLRYPMKLDFCRMTLAELTAVMHRVLQDDGNDPEAYRPVVAIGHTKDLSDPQTVDDFLSFLQSRGIGVTTFDKALSKLSEPVRVACAARVG